MSQTPDFVHLHVHSQYSMLDGAIRPKDLVDRVAELGMAAVAVTDHGNLFGALDFQKQAGKKIKPIFGCEFYVAPGSMADRTEKKPYHLLALAETDEGWRNLCRLSSKSYIEGFYYKPRIDKDTLAEHAPGLILASACLNGEIPVHLRQGRHDAARKAALDYVEIVGRGNFFLELMDTGEPDQKAVNRELVALARELDLPLIATNDVHFLKVEHYEAHEIIACIGTGDKMSNPDRFRLRSNQYYLKSPQEMAALFGEVPEALSNTVEIARRCNARIETVDTAPPGQKYKIPRFDAPEGKPEPVYLRELVEAGLVRRYGDKAETHRERTEMELGVIERMGFCGYFLIVWDLVHYARTHDIPVGPGRGSAAGSIVSYCLGITDIDPIAYDLFFERFLNPSRISMPDIDIDFCVMKRGLVIDYIKRRYGVDRVAQIITYSYMKAKAVIKDVARVLEFDFEESNRITALVPDGPGVKLADAFKDNPELAAFRDKGPAYEKLFRNAFTLENVTRHVGIHAAGVVISDRPLVDYVPLYKDQKTDGLVSQFDGPRLESTGLLKMDILGLNNLTTIAACLKLIHDGRGVDVDFDALDFNDEKTYALLQSGRSLGVFQLDSLGMQQLLKDLRPQRFEEIIALIALYRPGPLNQGMHTRFVARKHGAEPIEYLFPQLEPILRDTYGIIVYQEQVMLISRVVGGFSMAEADELRKAMGKKLVEIVNAKRAQFVEGAKHGGFDVRKAEQLYDQMAEFAEYGFNKSHSAAYAVISYRTAWLKANYPLEYMAALLTGVKNDTATLSLYIKETRGMGIRVLPPDVNHSERDFAVERDALRFGLSAIKGVGESAADAVVAARDGVPVFRTLADFCKGVDLHVLNRRVIEALVASGAFASLRKKRSVLMAQLDGALERGQQDQVDRRRGQVTFFDQFDGEAAPADAQLEQDLEEWPRATLLEKERELLGTYLTGHPLDRYAATLDRLRTTPTAAAPDLKHGQRARFAGIVRAVNSKSGNRGPWAIVTLEDREGSADVFFFTEAWEKYRLLCEAGRVLLVEAACNRQRGGNRTSLNAERAQELDELLVKDLHIHLADPVPDNGLFDLREELIDSRFRGESRVFFHVPVAGGDKAVTVRAGDSLTVTPTEELLGTLRRFGFVEKIVVE